MQAAYLDLIDDAFRRIAAGEAIRLLLTMPPRHGESRRAARWAPLWYLLQRPDHRVMIASYSSDLADDHGRWIRDATTTWGDQLGLQLRPGSRAANRFDIASKEGGLFAAGVGYGPTGKGAHLAIVDDPIKDDVDAQSPTMRRKLWEWWQVVLLTRIEPGGSVIVIQARWNEPDLRYVRHHGYPPEPPMHELVRLRLQRSTPEQDRRDGDGGPGGLAGPVVAGGQAPPLLEPVEAAFDDVAEPAGVAIEGGWAAIV